MVLYCAHALAEQSMRRKSTCVALVVDWFGLVKMLVFGGVKLKKTAPDHNPTCSSVRNTEVVYGRRSPQGKSHQIPEA